MKTKFLLLTLAATALMGCTQEYAFKSTDVARKSTSLNCDGAEPKVIGNFTVEQNTPVRFEYPLNNVQWYIIFPEGEKIFDGSVLEYTFTETGDYVGVVWGFDDCKVRHQQNFVIKVVPKLDGPQITINQNAIYTRTANVELQLAATNANEMKISLSPTCASGSWEPYSAAKGFTLSKEGLDERVYAQFKNQATESACVSDGIVFDKTPPDTKFVKVPASQSPNAAAEFEFGVTDLVSGVKEIYCALDQEPIQICSVSIKIPDVAYGTHAMHLSALDNAGNISDVLNYSFERTNPAPTVTITSAPPVSTTAKVANFTFIGQDDGVVAGYECSLDGLALTACTSPIAYQNLIEGSHEFKVRALDAMGLASVPAVHKWMITKVVEPPPPPVLTPPVVRITKAPVTGTDNSSLFEFEIDHPGVALASTSCQIDRVRSGACSSPINFGPLTIGKHTFSVIAVDANGLTSNRPNHEWEIIKPRVPVDQTFTIDSLAKKLDIIIVVDNSPSMAEEQKKMAVRFATFIDKLKNVDWQIGIITTDAGDGTKPYKGGKLVPFEGLKNTYAINKATPGLEAVFAKTIRRKEWGSSNEEGIRALLKSFSVPANQFFFREQSHVASIIVSDEDEHSDGKNLKTVNQPENLITSFSTHFSTRNTYSNHSIVLQTKTSTKDCPQEGTFAPGETYMKLSRLTKGVIGNLCDNDYGQTLKGIADNINERTYSALLKCFPDGPVTVKITPTPAAPVITTVVGATITLTPYPALGSKVDVTYYCQ